MAARTKYKTREDWLNALAVALDAEIFAPTKQRMPKKFRVTCGWPTRGVRGRKQVLGQCHSPRQSADKSTEITITMSLSDPVEVADVLVHEMVHAVVGNDCGHKGPFRKLALEIGLEGKMTSAEMGAELTAKVKKLIKPLGKYPHAELRLSDKKKQSTRLIKCECDACGYNVRITRKWLEEAGEPHCPMHGKMGVAA